MLIPLIPDHQLRKWLLTDHQINPSYDSIVGYSLSRLPGMPYHIRECLSIILQCIFIFLVTYTVHFPYIKIHKEYSLQLNKFATNLHFSSWAWNVAYFALAALTEVANIWIWTLFKSTLNIVYKMNISIYHWNIDLAIYICSILS